jgi:SAM-dependent methyltransferase
MARQAADPEWDSEMTGGLPVPPPLLRVRVSGNTAPRLWLQTGARDAFLIEGLLRQQGVELDPMEAVLDFGCGCGRVLRHWVGRPGPDFHGVDISRAGVRWCSRHLPFVQATRIDHEPPLPFPDAKFDFVYALSVLTHLTEEGGRRWLSELVRVLKPSGLLLFTVHGEYFLGDLDAAGAERFREGEPVFLDRPPELAGTSQFAAFHPESYLRALLPSLGLDLLEALHHDPTGARRAPMPPQDNYLARRRAQ